MCTSKNQCVDLLILKFLQISSCNLFCDRIMIPSLFHQRYKKRTCFPDHGDLRIQLPEIGSMDTAVYRTYCANDPYSLVPGLLSSHFSTGFDHSENRDIQFILYRIQSKSTGCVTGYNNGFYFLFLQKMNDLAGITDNCLSGLTSIWNPGCISEIYDFFRWEIAHDLPGYCQSSDTGIKHTNRCVSVYIH